MLNRTFSLVRNNATNEHGNSFHLKQIDEDGELCLIEDLGGEHEESLDEDEDEDEILIVSKRPGREVHSS